MRIPILRNLLWIPDDRMTDQKRRQVKEELTVAPYSFIGNPPEIKLYVESNGYLGVPRAWGQKKIGGILTEAEELDDQTTRPMSIWPERSVIWRPGQAESVTEIVRSFVDKGKYGALLEASPGSGKTLMGLAVAQNLCTPTLVLVHKNDLADQWQESGRKFFPGCTRGHVQGDDWDYKNKNFVTAMAQTLYSRREEIPKDFWGNFGLVIYDEGHRYCARTFEYLFRKPYARYRLGVSATWRRKDKLEFIWHWHVGQVEHRTKSQMLSGTYHQVSWSTSLDDKMFRVGRNIGIVNWITAISKNAPFNVWLSDQLSSGAAAGRRVLCVSDRVDQLVDIRSRLLKSGSPASVGMYISALPDATGKRKKVSKEDLDKAKGCNIILATYKMMSEGTDIPELDTLFFGTPRVDIEQVVGRIQRHGKDKKELLVVDPVFDTPYMKRMAKKRLTTYRKLDFKPQQ